ncbi:MAG: hypothetical protein ACRC1L_07400 [Prochlorococcaceae cyanobacterium]
MNEILRSPAYERIIPCGITPVVWATGYMERAETHQGGSIADGLTLIDP